jgi:hypothetical protein
VESFVFCEFYILGGRRGVAVEGDVLLQLKVTVVLFLFMPRTVS